MTRRSALAAGFTVLFVTTGVNLSFGLLFKPILLTLGGARSTLALAATAGGFREVRQGCALSGGDGRSEEGN